MNKAIVPIFAGGGTRLPAHLGVLKALRSSAKWQADGVVKTSNAPWEALSLYQAHLSHGNETFQAYPNRDSLPFIKQYHFHILIIMRSYINNLTKCLTYS